VKEFRAHDHPKMTRSRSEAVKQAKDRSNEILGNRVAKYELVINKAIRDLQSLTTKSALDKVIDDLKGSLR
jgi:hypothetical protein